MGREIVVIGCGAGGGTAAQFARKSDRKASVTILEASKYPQYSKCALPYFLSKKVSDIIEFSEEWFKHFGIDLFLETKVIKIDVDNHKIIAKKKDEIIERSYDSLILATGANSSIPPISGLKKDNGTLLEGVFTLRDIDDAISISSYISRVKNVVIIGAGLIGLEMAEAFVNIGVKVTVVEMLPNILPSMVDPDISNILLGKIPADVNILLGYKVDKIISTDNVVKSVVISNEKGDIRTLDTDMLLISTGIKPNVKLAKDIGCKIGNTGAICIDGRSQTSIKNIYAVGDCTEYNDFITGKPIQVGLGSIAVKQGIIAGINAAGGDEFLPRGFLQTRTTKLFGVEIAAVGPVSNQTNQFIPVSGKYTGSSLPDYFPGGKTITIKILADSKKGRIIGAQAIGSNASQRINTLACAIMNEMNLESFVKMETAYAPPVAPTLDAMTIACDIARVKYERRKQN